MVRLIDADALQIVTRGKNHHRKYVFADITDAPTIDAIPVEWLRDKMLNGERRESQAAWLMLKTWDWEQKEQ